MLSDSEAMIHSWSCGLTLPTHCYTDRITPLADAAVVYAINCAIGPFRRRSRKRRCVRIAGRRVICEQDEALTSIDFDLANVEIVAESAPSPRDLHLATTNLRGDVRFNSGEVRAALFLALDTESFADRGIIIRARLDLFY